MMRMSTGTNDVTTLAVNFLINCEAGRTFTADLMNGEVSPGPSTTQEGSLLSFTAFHYNLTNGRSTAWSVYRSSNWTAGASEMNPFTFDTEELTVGRVSWNVQRYEVTISEAGNYYVYVSGIAQPNRALGLTMQRNGDDVFTVERTSTNWNGVDSLGRGAVINLNVGDKLKVVAEPNTAGYSAQERRHTSFFGFLVV